MKRNDALKLTIAIAVLLVAGFLLVRYLRTPEPSIGPVAPAAAPAAPAPPAPPSERVGGGRLAKPG